MELPASSNPAQRGYRKPKSAPRLCQCHEPSFSTSLLFNSTEATRGAFYKSPGRRGCNWWSLLLRKHKFLASRDDADTHRQDDWTTPPMASSNASEKAECSVQLHAQIAGSDVRASILCRNKYMLAAEYPHEESLNLLRIRTTIVIQLRAILLAN